MGLRAVRAENVEWVALHEEVGIFALLDELEV
jgi:hypothetical protein